jgi:carbamoyltransferase
MVINNGERLFVADKRMGSVSWGPQYSDVEVSRVLDACQQTYSRPRSIVDAVAELLDRGEVVGWFQGQMEGGPRTLGNRSILADPRNVASRDRVNSVIKFREFWRPFCPSMTPKGAERYLTKYTHAPFMILGFEGTKTAAKEIPAVVHVDNTLRVQIVEENDNEIYFKLLEAFEKRTGVPCLLNTSFNIKGEPIVCTPHDAIRTFSATGLDALAIGPFLLRK